MSTQLALNLIMPSLSVSVSNRLSHRVRAIDPFRAVLGAALRGIWHSDIPLHFSWGIMLLFPAILF